MFHFLSLAFSTSARTNGIQDNIKEFSSPSPEVLAYPASLLRDCPPQRHHTLWCYLAKVLITAMKVTGEDHETLNPL